MYAALREADKRRDDYQKMLKISASPGADLMPPLCGLTIEEYENETFQAFIKRLSYQEVASMYYSKLQTWECVVNLVYDNNLHTFIATTPRDHQHTAARFFNALNSRATHIRLIESIRYDQKVVEKEARFREWCIRWIPFVSWFFPSPTPKNE